MKEQDFIIKKIAKLLYPGTLKKKTLATNLLKAGEKKYINQPNSQQKVNVLPRREKKSCKTPIRSPRVSPLSHTRPETGIQIDEWFIKTQQPIITCQSVYWLGNTILPLRSDQNKISNTLLKHGPFFFVYYCKIGFYINKVKLACIQIQ